jgi:uncharacterized protein YaaW (UPF0174 family)
MTDGLSMETAGTSQAMTSLDTAGSTLAQGWATARSTIDSLGGQLGQGPLGQAFIQGYQPAAAAASQAMDATIPALQQLAQLGRQGVSTYTQANQNAGNAYNGL